MFVISKNSVFNEFKQYVCGAELAKRKTYVGFNDVNEVIADTEAVAHDKVTLADDWWQCSCYSVVFLFTTQSSGSRARTCGQSASHTSPETRIYEISGTVYYNVQCTG